MRLKNTKKGDRYASFQLEDKSGFIEVIVWPETYKRCGETLASDDPILVVGKMDVGEERVQIIANDVTPLEEASRQLPPLKKRENGGRVHIYLRDPRFTAEDLGALREMLLRHPGKFLVLLHFPDNSESVIESDLHVSSDAELLQQMAQLFGERVTLTPATS